MTAKQISPDDEDFLYGLLDRALTSVEDGLPIDLDTLLGPRTDLRSEAERLVRLAGRVGLQSTSNFPDVNGYTLLSEVGRGGMGVVYLARQERVGGRTVALKVLPSAAGLSARARERFRSEALAIAKLQHPNVVAVYDVVRHHDTFAYAMELVDGSTLADWIESARTQSLRTRSNESAAARATLNPKSAIRNPGSPNPASVARLGASIARALAAVHAAGLLHRDVKPSNILLRRDGTPLLSDFGLVREADSTLTQPGLFAGTVAYSPPEQLRGDSAALDARSDVYALGVTLYHALALRLPFQAREPSAMLARIERGLAIPLRRANPRVPRDLETVIAKAMDPDPARRYQTATDFADDLQRVLNFQPIRARRASLPVRAAKFARRNRAATVAAVAGGLLSLALAGGAVVFWFLRPMWVAEHVREARLALLDPEQANMLFSLRYFGGIEEHGSSRRRKMANLLPLALKQYDAALRWSPFDRELRAERDVVAEIKAIGAGPAPPYLSAGINGAARDAEATDRSDLPSLRLRGLRAFLRYDVEAAIAAWTAYESSTDLTLQPDPLIVGALGILYLVENRPALAYPRLRDAVQAFPEAIFLSMYLADAAIQCGDLNEGRRLLERAKAEPGWDELYELERAAGDLLFAEARQAQAAGKNHAAAQFVAAAEESYRRHEFGLSKFRLAELYEATGQPEKALTQYEQIFGGAPMSRRACRAYAPIADRWWASLSDKDRLAAIRAALDEPPDRPASLVSRLRVDQMAKRGASKAANHAPISRHGFAVTAAVLMPGSISDILSSGTATIFEAILSPSLQRLSLPELAERMEVENMPLWNRIHGLSGAEKRLVLDSWKSPALRPVVRSLLGIRTVVSIAAALLARSAYAQCDSPPCFQGLGDLPGGLTKSYANGISADGTTVVGTSESANGTEAYRWRTDTGMVGLGDLPGGSFNSRGGGVSADGQIIAGDSAEGTDITNGFYIAYRWTPSSGMMSLQDIPGGWYYSTMYNISDDGLIGAGQTAVDGGAYAAIYKVGSGWQLIHFSGGQQSNVYGLSRNGTWAVGARSFAPSYQDSDAFRWSADTGLQILADLPGGDEHANAAGVSNDGAYVVGQATDDHGTQAVSWTPDGSITQLGDLSGPPYNSRAMTISADGSLIVGWGTTAAGQEAAIWDDHRLIHRLLDFLAPLGVNVPSGWILNSANQITVNGDVVTIVGDGINPIGNPEGWIARYSLSAPPVCVGDLNHDRVVDLGDLAILISQYGCTPDCPGCADCSADMNGDLIVDLEDLANMLGHYGHICP